MPNLPKNVHQLEDGDAILIDGNGKINLLIKNA
jgi:hypothetical protein